MATRRFVSIGQLFFTPEALVPFLFGSVFLGVLANAVFSLLTFYTGQSSPLPLAAIAIGSVFIFLSAAWLFTKFLERVQPRPIHAHTHQPSKHRGLILLVSRLDPCEQAIAYHQPKLEQCWLLCSAQTLPIAQQLQKNHTDVCVEDPIIVNDLNNPLEVKNLIEQRYTRLPNTWSESDLIVDYTGMTAHCSVGAALACLPSTRHLQYTPALFDENRDPQGSGQPIEIRLDWERVGVSSRQNRQAKALKK